MFINDPHGQTCHQAATRSGSSSWTAAKGNEAPDVALPATGRKSPALTCLSPTRGAYEGWMPGHPDRADPVSRGGHFPSNGASLQAALVGDSHQERADVGGSAGALAIGRELGGRNFDEFYGKPAAFPVSHFLRFPE